ncbi:ROK family protein [Blastococcus xanthinilyticus]|uniref:ROK family protein n=1 Tax=Blastococcus xanthinilyticus TaxID=1564164 RepID=A0A5S5D3C2_9ACTN|nr:ROK family protein [Blastococcus xanthinilyticus]TYP90470.1 ROK family protein [Blastococcus xanthinilyticus]
MTSSLADVVVVLIGQSLGTSIFTTGSSPWEPMPTAGEWGHTAVVVEGRLCRCGARGCLEDYVGADAVVKRYEELRGPDGEEPQNVEARATELLAAVDTDPAAAAVVLEEVVRYLGAGVGNLVDVFSPRRVVLGGWFGRQLAERRMTEIIELASRDALRTPFEDVEVVRADLGVDAVAMGAATLPVARFLSSGGQRDAARGGRPRATVAADEIQT